MIESSNIKRIACVGEAMVELMLGNNSQSSANLGFAGDTLNTAIYLKRLLGEDVTVSYLTHLGHDSLSTRLLQFMRDESLDVDKVNFSPDRSIGLYAIETDDKGERTFSYWRSHSAAKTLFNLGDKPDFDVLKQFDVIFFSAITLAILPDEIRVQFMEKLAQLRSENEALVCFDSNYRPALWENEQLAKQRIADAWKVTDIALPSIDDEQSIFGDSDESDLLKRFKNYGVNQGALKRGELGPITLSNKESDTPAQDIQFSTLETVVDTTAAGDSFNAGYLSAVFSGRSQQEALLAGHECSLRVIANAGAIIPRSKW